MDMNNQLTHRRLRAFMAFAMFNCLTLFVTSDGHAAPATPIEQNDIALAPDLAILKKHGVSADASGIKDLLRSLRPTPEQAKMVAKLIKQLGSNDFTEREAASAALSRLPVPPTKALEKAAADQDPERSHRAKEILKRLKGKSSVQPLLFVAARVAVAKGLNGLSTELKQSLAICENEVVQRAVKLAIQLEEVPDKTTSLPTWEAYLQTHLVQGNVENTTTEFLKDVPSIVLEQFKSETRTANTSGAVVSRHQTAPWLYPMKDKGELPRIIKEKNRHLYPVWGTWKQRYADWITLSENASHIHNAAAHSGPHYASQVQFIVLPTNESQQSEN